MLRLVLPPHFSRLPLFEGFLRVSRLPGVSEGSRLGVARKVLLSGEDGSRVSRGICAAFLLALVGAGKEKQKRRGNRSTPDSNPTLHPAPLRRCQHVPPAHQQSHGHHHAEHSGGHIHAVFHPIAFLWLTFSFFLRMVRASPFPQGGSILIQPAAQVEPPDAFPGGDFILFYSKAVSPGGFSPFPPACPSNMCVPRRFP